jgi:uncharacterized protein (TIGR02271 family)
MPQTVIGLFNDFSQASNAQARLLQAGFSGSTVDVSHTAATETATDTTRDDNDDRGEGKVTRFFKNLFGVDDEADRYANVARHSEAIVTVHADSPEIAQRAAAVLDDSGALDVDEVAAQYASGADYTSGGEYAAGGQTTNTGRYADTADEKLEVIEENLQVGKRSVETGGVRIRSRIVEHAVEEDVRLREEHVSVDRRPVDRPASEADLQAFREGEVEVIEHAEVPVVAKEARVVEEVLLNKEQDERTETVRDTVRKTEVDVENLQSETTPRNPRR